jgi:hypothetical protein
VNRKTELSRPGDRYLSEVRSPGGYCFKWWFMWARYAKPDHRWWMVQCVTHPMNDPYKNVASRAPTTDPIP